MWSATQLPVDWFLELDGVWEPPVYQPTSDAADHT